MKEQDIIHRALENLEQKLNIRGKWIRNCAPNNHTQLDGRLELRIEGKMVCLYAEVKREVRSHTIEPIERLAEQFPPLIVVANRISPTVKEQLRRHTINYLEASGNIYLRHNGVLLWIEGNRPVALQKEHSNRAFTKTGLKVLFRFLIDENSINLPYREIASLCDVGLGNVNNIMNGLKKENFVAEIGRNHYKLVNKKKLLERWTVSYAERLQPTLEIGIFKQTGENADTWKDIALHSDSTLWGGEPAGALLTGHIRPSLLTMYTVGSRTELIKNYKIIPDAKGNIRAYKMFWRHEPNGATVPPLLVYTDLINSNDPRCIETAKMIYDKYLEKEF